MSRPSFLMRRKLLLFLSVAGVLLYLLLWYHRRLVPNVPNYPLPDYILAEGYASRIYHQYFPLYLRKNSSSSVNTFVYIPTQFNENTVYISSLLRYNSYVAGVLSEEFASEVLFPKSTFFCTCGRVSDPCVCCGILHPEVSNQNRLSPDLYQPILLKDGNSLDGKFDKSVLRFTYLSTVFGTLYLPSSPLPVICSGHSKNNYDVDLCVNFTTLEYKFDSDHKTVFHGCAFIQIVLSRTYVIGRYPKFCFDAHRGAAGDADQASNKKLSENVVMNPLNPSNNYSMTSNHSPYISNFGSSNTSQSSHSNPSGQSFLIVNDGSKNPKASLEDSDELHRGIP
ncbi:hypothetical protein EWB00_005856 [Schistosoma japonicum]|uniref:Uncharacterized protein n=1 Tax=Schistosoma japonicum TaxID=6182 RepID=A0A4Z2D0J8_SCHJA|nr:hypothetical protein EWB00_005856 [Schistosoma japonicum]